MGLSADFAEACEAVKRSAAAIAPFSSRLQREAELTRHCLVCEDRRRIGYCPGRRGCIPAQRLHLDEVEELRYVVGPMGLRRHSEVLPVRFPTIAPLTAAIVGGTNGSSQEG